MGAGEQMARQSDDVDKASHALLYLGKAHLRLKSSAAGIEALSAAIQVPKGVGCSRCLSGACCC